jgi:hypothetical protein
MRRLTVTVNVDSRQQFVRRTIVQPWVRRQNDQHETQIRGSEKVHQLKE